TVSSHRPTGKPSPSEPERSHYDVFGDLILALEAGRLRALSSGVRRCRSVGDTTSGSWRRPARSSAGRGSRWSSRRPRRRVRSAGLSARAGGGLRRGAWTGPKTRVTGGRLDEARLLTRSEENTAELHSRYPPEHRHPHGLNK